jgi:hypothetical protein
LFLGIEPASPTSVFSVFSSGHRRTGTMTEPENFDDELFADLYVPFADGIAKGGY